MEMKTFLCCLGLSSFPLAAPEAAMGCGGVGPRLRPGPEEQYFRDTQCMYYFCLIMNGDEPPGRFRQAAGGAARRYLVNCRFVLCPAWALGLPCGVDAEQVTSSQALVTLAGTVWGIDLLLDRV